MHWVLTRDITELGLRKLMTNKSVQLFLTAFNSVIMEFSKPCFIFPKYAKARGYC